MAIREQDSQGIVSSTIKAASTGETSRRLFTFATSQRVLKRQTCGKLLQGLERLWMFTSPRNSQRRVTDLAGRYKLNHGEDKVEEALNNVWFGSYKLRANLSKFKSKSSQKILFTSSDDCFFDSGAEEFLKDDESIFSGNDMEYSGKGVERPVSSAHESLIGQNNTANIKATWDRQKTAASFSSLGKENSNCIRVINSENSKPTRNDFLSLDKINDGGSGPSKFPQGPKGKGL